MGTPAGYHVRPPTPDDLGAVAAVLAADDLDDAGRVVLDAEFVRDGWGRPDFDLANDAWVVADDAGTVVAYGQVTRDEGDVVESWGVVHPAYRGRGLGPSLLDRIEERGAALTASSPSARFRHAINAGDTAAAALLRSRGLHLVRHFWHMEIEFGLVGSGTQSGSGRQPQPGSRPEPGPQPQGIEICGLGGPDDLEAVHAVIDEAFADHWDHVSEPFDRWVEEMTRGPSYDPTLWLLAKRDGELVGALTAIVLGERGWVGLLGVLAAHRGRGIAAALLRRSFVAFAARGIGRVLLAVDAENPTGATALYEHVGMSVVKRWDLWERPLGRGGRWAGGSAPDPGSAPRS